MTAQQVIREVSATGAKFVIEGNEIGLTKAVPDELLLKAKTHKSEIRKILLAIKRPESNVVDIARARLIKASNGLDVSIDELMNWYENDYEQIKQMTKVSELRFYIVDYLKMKKRAENK